MIKRELAIFLVVGVTTVLVDFVVYRGLIKTTLVTVDIAKAVGFLTGTWFAYFANRLWTFAHKPHAPGGVQRFVMLYSVTLIINVLINMFLLRLLADFPAAMQLAFVLATGASSCTNFLGMKFFVFGNDNTNCEGLP